jgi:hypothetical protein
MSAGPPVKIPQTAHAAWHEWLIVIAGYTLTAVATLWPLADRLRTAMVPAVTGDPLLNAWILAWDADRMRHGFAGLWNAPLFYPASDTLAWSEHLIGIALFTAPVQWLTGQPVLVYNLAQLASVVLAGAGMYGLARELTGRRDAAWLAGLAFACLPYRISQLTHLQILVCGWMPIALWALHRAFRTGSWRAYAAFAAAYTLQALSNGYYLFFLAAAVGVFCAIELVSRVRHRAPVLRQIVSLVLAATVVMVCLVPVLTPYLRVRAQLGLKRTRPEIIAYAAQPWDYLTVTSLARTWRNVLPVGRPERELFPGLTLLLLAAAATPALIRRDRTAWTLGAVALVGAVLSLGPEPGSGSWRAPTGPYDWLMVMVPGMDGLRVPARCAIVVYVGLCGLAAIGAAALLGPAGSRRAWAVLAVASLAIAFEGSAAPVPFERFPLPGMRADRAAYEWVKTQPAAAMLELPVGGTAEQTRYLYGTRTHGNRIVNGYSGYGSALQDFFGGPPTVEAAQIPDALAAARAIGVRYVLVHRSLYRDPTQAGPLLDAVRSDTADVVRTVTFDDTTVAVLAPALVPVAPPAARGDLAGCHASASTRGDLAALAIDHDPATRWISEQPQRGSEWLEISCETTRTITGIDIDVNRRSYGDYPRRLRVERSADGLTFATAWEGSVLPSLAASLVRHDAPTRVWLALPPAPTRAVRLRQVGATARAWFWAVDDIHFHFSGE